LRYPYKSFDARGPQTSPVTSPLRRPIGDEDLCGEGIPCKVTTRRQPYKAVFFDLDGTLCDYDESARLSRAGAFDVLLEHHPELDRATVEREFLQIIDARLNPEKKQEFLQTPLAPASLSFVKLGQRLGAPDYDFAVRLGLIYRDLRHKTLRLFPSAAETIAALRGKVHLGIITNGRSDVQRGELAALGIASEFETIIVSEEVGARKPEKRIFELAARAAGSAPEDAVFAGDDPAVDIDGALRADWSAVWMNRNWADYPQGLARPTYTVRELREVVELVS
jgi:putative hydrolase of the HAD superfamily